jgi:hypothetical protein
MYKLMVSIDLSSSLLAGKLSSQPFVHFTRIDGLLTNWKQIIPHIHFASHIHFFPV